MSIRFVEICDDLIDNDGDGQVDCDDDDCPEGWGSCGRFALERPLLTDLFYPSQVVLLCKSLLMRRKIKKLA